VLLSLPVEEALKIKRPLHKKKAFIVWLLLIFQAYLTAKCLLDLAPWYKGYHAAVLVPVAETSSGQFPPPLSIRIPI
jgi:hypothetical protein